MLIENTKTNFIKRGEIIKGMTKEWIEQEYWTNQKSLRDIEKQLDISYQTIRRRMVEFEIPLRRKEEALRLKRMKNFDKSKTKSINYILGVLLGDGFLCEGKSKGIIGLGIAEKDFKFAESFRDALKDIGLNPLISKIKLKDKNPSLSDQIRVIARSTPFYKWRKSLDINEIEEFIIRDIACMKEFIRGFYESEGTIYRNCWRKQKNKGNWLGLRIVNTRKEILDLVNKILLQLGFNFYKHETMKNGKPYYYLGIWKRSEITRFIEEINPVIKREPRKV